MSQRVTFVVDRLEGKMAVLVADSDERQLDVPRRALPKDGRREGAVLTVELDASGAPDWRTARVDEEEERRRREDSVRQLDRLKKRDPGGDIAL